MHECAAEQTKDCKFCSRIVPRVEKKQQCCARCIGSRGRCARNRLDYAELVEDYPWCAYHQRPCRELAASYHVNEKTAETFEPVTWLQDFILQRDNRHMVSEPTPGKTNFALAQLLENFPALLDSDASRIQLQRALDALTAARHDRLALLEQCYNWVRNSGTQEDMDNSDHCTMKTEAHVYRVRVVASIISVLTALSQRWREQNMARKNAQRKRVGGAQDIKAAPLISDQEEEEEDVFPETEEPKDNGPPSPELIKSAESPPCTTVDDLTVEQICSVLGEVKVANEESPTAVLDDLRTFTLPRGTVALLDLQPKGMKNKRYMVSALFDERPIGYWHLLVANIATKETKKPSCWMPTSLRAFLIEAGIAAGSIVLDVKSSQSEDRFWLLMPVVHRLCSAKWLADGELPGSKDLEVLLFSWNLVADVSVVFHERARLYVRAFASSTKKAITRQGGGLSAAATRKIGLLGVWDAFVRAIGRSGQRVDIARVALLNDQFGKLAERYDVSASLREGARQSRPGFPLSHFFVTCIFLVNLIAIVWLAPKKRAVMTVLLDMNGRLKSACPN